MALDGNAPISSGSGILVGDGSIAITCAHCIIPGKQIVARFSGQSNVIAGRVMILEQQKDIAIISYSCSIGAGVTIRDSSSVLLEMKHSL